MHPLTAALYLKRVEGRARDGRPIRPKSVSARAHAITRMKTFRDAGLIRCNYHDIDDFSIMHVAFEDGTVADLISSDIVLGGIHNWLEICATITARTATSIRTRPCRPTTPSRRTSRTSTSWRRSRQRRAGPAPRRTKTGSPATRRKWKAFYGCIATGTEPESNSMLAADAISTIYSAYVSAERTGAAVDVRTFGS